MSHFIEDLMTKKRSYANEIDSLCSLFHSVTYVRSEHDSVSLYKYMSNDNIFLQWRFRGTFTSIDEMTKDNGIDDVLDKVDEMPSLCNLDDYILVAEFMINVAEYLRGRCQLVYIKAIFDNIYRAADKYNLKVVQKENSEIILTNKDVMVDIAADSLDNKTLSELLYEYGRQKNQDDIGVKESIIAQLFKGFFEPNRQNIKNLNNDLEKKIGILSGCARHDDNSNVDYKDMSNEEKIKVLDITFDLYTEAIVLLKLKDTKAAAKQFINN